MRSGNFRISTRLTAGMGAIMFLVGLLGLVSFYQSTKLWQNTDEMYKHPYKVSNAARDIYIDVLEMHRRIKDIALFDEITPAHVSGIKIIVDSLEKRVYSNFNIVYENFLGPKEYIDSAFTYFNRYKSVRNTLISTRLSQSHKEAELRYKGDNSIYVDKMIAEIIKMNDFSSDKGYSFYKNAAEEKSDFMKNLLILTGSILILSLGTTIVTVRSIKNPLKDLVNVTNRFSSGRYESRSDYVSPNEIGLLASTFNQMASTVQNELLLRENIAMISGKMMDENELKPFCRKLLETLIPATSSQVGAIFLLDSEKGNFVHFDSIGMNTTRIMNFSAKNFEGEIGTVLGVKKITRIEKIPVDTIFTFPAVIGSFHPREILTIPVLDDDEVIAIVSLSSIHPYPDIVISIIEGLWLTLTARMVGVLNYQKILDYTEILDRQKRELEELSREMVMQTEELKENNIELGLQKRQLDEANSLKSAFLSNMSHELRTPLNSVIALSGVLNRRLNGKIPEEEYSYLSIIEKNGKSLLILINEILDLARIEAGKEEIMYSKFSAGALVNDILISLRRAAEEKNISVKNMIDEHIYIISDRIKCNHILQNLISNAIKFTEKGSVDITAHFSEGYLVISVRDTGIGIPSDFIPFIFDEFRQVDDKMSRRFGGTGLGLAIVKKYCQLLEGKIDVISNFGEGSVFKLTLPLSPEAILSDDERTDEQEAQSNVSYTKAFKQKTILIVEDSEPQIIQIRDILLREGFNILVARNGQEALDSINKFIPDAMILDLEMPGINGFEVVKEIRAHHDTVKIPVLILTARHITKAELKMFKGNSIHQLIQKGNVTKDELICYIRKIFEPGRSAGAEPSKGIKEKKTGSGRTVLLIEDNADNMVSLKALLKENFNILEAVDGNEGLEKAQLYKPDIILLDISLPEMDGFTVLDELKKSNELRGIPVVALTARSMKGDRENLLAYGFDGYISKPVDHDTFEKSVREYLNETGM